MKYYAKSVESKKNIHISHCAFRAGERASAFVVRVGKY